MNAIFKYSVIAEYSTKDLNGGHDNINFSLLDIYLDKKEPPVKIRLLDIFKDHHIVAKWRLPNALWVKFCNSHGKYRPKLNEYFHMYQSQLNFALFCTTRALGISLQHFNHSNLLVRSV